MHVSESSGECTRSLRVGNNKQMDAKEKYGGSTFGFVVRWRMLYWRSAGAATTPSRQCQWYRALCNRSDARIDIRNRGLGPQNYLCRQLFAMGLVHHRRQGVPVQGQGQSSTRHHQLAKHAKGTCGDRFLSLSSAQAPKRRHQVCFQIMIGVDATQTRRIVRASRVEKETGDGES